MLKQNPMTISFLGTSRNAMLTQIWIEMIAFLLLAYLRVLSIYEWTVNSLMKVLPTVLFSRRDLVEWLRYPFGSPFPGPVEHLQFEIL